MHRVQSTCAARPCTPASRRAPAARPALARPPHSLTVVAVVGIASAQTCERRSRLLHKTRASGRQQLDLLSLSLCTRWSWQPPSAGSAAPRQPAPAQQPSRRATGADQRRDAPAPPGADLVLGITVHKLLSAAAAFSRAPPRQERNQRRHGPVLPHTVLGLGARPARASRLRGSRPTRSGSPTGRQQRDQRRLAPAPYYRVPVWLSNNAKGMSAHLQPAHCTSAAPPGDSRCAVHTLDAKACATQPVPHARQVHTAMPVRHRATAAASSKHMTKAGAVAGRTAKHARTACLSLHGPQAKMLSRQPEEARQRARVPVQTRQNMAIAQ